ncbi:MAG TPA: hypothetical protein VIK08_12170 [Candidatus Limnocylindrales bacterium]
MSRRSQSRRRRTYGRRQHEVRERRPDSRTTDAWLADPELDADNEWHSSDSSDERAVYGDPYGGFAQ